MNDCRGIFRATLLILGIGSLSILAGCSLGNPFTEDDSPTNVGRADLGPNPFAEIETSETPDEFTTVEAVLKKAANTAEDEFRAEAGPAPSGSGIGAARLDAIVDAAEEVGLEVELPASPAGVGLYGGTGENVCDVEQMILFMAENPDYAQAWADVEGIEPEEIATYLRSLEAGYLIDDSSVINHGFRDGEAYGFETVLEAGTAVLVDASGVPRVRCRCGNPLLPTTVLVDDQAVDVSNFADRLVEASIDPDVPEFEEGDSDDGFYTNDPSKAVGAPDQYAVGMGDDPDTSPESCAFYLVLEFVDNRLVDGPGDDLRIVELGGPEPTYVSVGTSLEDLRFVGEVSGGTSAIDISGVAAPGEEFRYVKICDGPDNSSSFPGSDIDAILALNSVTAATEG